MFLNRVLISDGLTQYFVTPLCNVSKTLQLELSEYEMSEKVQIYRNIAQETPVLRDF